MPEEVFLEVEQGRTQPDAAGIIVVDEDVGLKVGLDEDRVFVEGRDPGQDVPRRDGFARQVVADGDADVVKVAHHEQRRDVVEEVGQAEQAVNLFLRREGQGLEKRSWDGQPVGGGVHLVLGKAQVPRADVLLSKEFNFFKPNDLGGDVDFAMGNLAAFQLFLVEDVQDLNFGVVDGVGEIIDVSLLDVGLALFEITKGAASMTLRP